MPLNKSGIYQPLKSYACHLQKTVADAEQNKIKTRRFKYWLDLRQNSSAWEEDTVNEGYNNSLQNYDRYGCRSAGQCLI